MSYTTTTIQDFLSRISPFNQIPSEAIAQLAPKFQFLRYRMGQAIAVRDKMPRQVTIIYEGKARLLGYDPRTKMPSTLKLLESGAIIGCVNLIRGVPCETAIASDEVTGLTIPNQDFFTLLAQYPQIQQQLKEQSFLIEIFDLIGHQLEENAQGEGNLKELALEAVPQAEVYSLPPVNII